MFHVHTHPFFPSHRSVRSAHLGPIDVARVFDELGFRTVREGPPPIRVDEQEGGYTLRVDLPGVAAEDISVTIEDSVLTIRATRNDGAKATEGENDTKPSWTYTRRLRLPNDVDADKLEAQLRNGVLTLTLPKQGRPEPRRIAVTQA